MNRESVSEIPIEALRNVCIPASLGCSTTDEMTPLETIIGQARAVKALCFGLDIKEPGFNIFVTGPPGTGRATAVQQFLQDEAREEAVPGDLCYVHIADGRFEPGTVHAKADQRLRALAEAMRDYGRNGIDA
jgi:Cdc6-like AAA superfamily ATPase